MPSSLPVALVIGASRGIGRQIALDLAQNGYAVAVAAKTTSNAYDPNVPFPPDPNSSQSTVNTVAREVAEAGGEATAIEVNVRDSASVERCVRAVVEKYNRLDVLIYNPGAIWWSSVESTPMKRFQLMQQVNVEGLYAAVQCCLPHLKRSASADAGGRIVVISPPIYSRFFRGKTAYAMGKVAMSVLTIGLGMDFVRQAAEGRKPLAMAISSLWPAVAIQSAATKQFEKRDPDELKDLRKPTIFGDAVLEILKAKKEIVNSRCLVDEDWLRESKGWGDEDMAKYSLVPGTKPRRIMPKSFPTLEVEEQADEGRRYDSANDKAKL